MVRMNKAFTLVEILIVVIILGILAAIVIPQFTQASDDAKASALQSDLQTVRSQLELYKVQHGCYPDRLAGAATSESDSAKFIERMTSKTDATGAVGTGVTHIYGPYLQKFPTNGFSGTGLNTVAFAAAPAGDSSTGWNFDPASGKFSANDSASTNSVAHKTW